MLHRRLELQMLRRNQAAINLGYFLFGTIQEQCMHTWRQGGEKCRLYDSEPGDCPIPCLSLVNWGTSRVKQSALKRQDPKQHCHERIGAKKMVL